MRYFTAIEAAQRIGVAEKTVRLWIKEGKLDAHHPAPNRLAIAEVDVERLARERRQYHTPKGETPSETPQPDISALSARVTELEQRVTELEQGRLTEKAENPSASTFNPYNTYPATSPQKRDYKRIDDIPDDLPPGTMGYKDFAEKYGVKPRTFSDQIVVGLGRGVDEKEKVDAIIRPHPSRTSETVKYLTPEQQEQALAFWDKYGVKYTKPTEENE